MKVDIIIQHGDNILYPAVQEGVELSLERKGTPGKLTFTVVEDAALSISEGDAVKLTVDGVNVFYGFVFTKKRSKEKLISITSYDQLRYLKNKDTYVYENKTATEVVQMIAQDFQLKLGRLEDTGYKLASRVEDNATLFDIIGNALDETLTATKKLFVLYDDAGKLRLQNVESMQLNLLLDADTLDDFDYKSTIDDNTYNQIKVVHEDSEKGRHDIFTARSGTSIDAWGVLQLTEKVDEPANGQAKAERLLSLYNQNTRTLTANGVLGRTDVRAGSSIVVSLSLGDIDVARYMVVESVLHTFNEQQHLMRLKLRGGGFVA